MDPLTVRVSGELSMRAGDSVMLTPQPGKLHRFGDDGKALA
jgi:multiple sugar transport system ATP-binding protein